MKCSICFFNAVTIIFFFQKDAVACDYTSTIAICDAIAITVDDKDILRGRQVKLLMLIN